MVKLVIVSLVINIVNGCLKYLSGFLYIINKNRLLIMIVKIDVVK